MESMATPCHKPMLSKQFLCFPLRCSESESIPQDVNELLSEFDEELVDPSLPSFTQVSEVTKEMTSPKMMSLSRDHRVMMT
jgi:hypothetical protein